MPGFARVCLPLALAAGFLPLIHGRAYAQRPPVRFVLTEQEAIELTTPVVVSEGMVTEAKWSADGRYLLAVRTRYPALPISSQARQESEVSIVVWNRDTQRSRTVWRAAGLMDPPEFQLEWVGKNPVVFGTVDTWKMPVSPPGKPIDPAAEPVRQRWLVRLDARSGVFRLLSEVAPNTQFHLSPTQPIALLYSYFSPEEHTVRFARADGVLGKPVALPLQDTSVTPEWREEGDFVVIGRIPKRVPRKRMVTEWFALDPATGSNRPLPTRPRLGPEKQKVEAPTDLKLTRRIGALPEEKPVVRFQPLWLETTTSKPEDRWSRALLSLNARWGKFSPAGDAVMYVADGAAWVCPLQRSLREPFLAAWRTAQRELLQSNAMKLGSGVMMYAQDYDETLPGAGDNIQALLMPYVNDIELFGDFVYTYPGGKIADIEVPSKTILGHTPVDGGRVLLFVDGHVAFEPNR